MRALILVIACACFAVPATAADHVVSQNNKAFSTASLQAKVGDTVSFRNDDTVAHNIFSLSDIQSFDLGMYSKGATRQVKLEKTGIVEIECAVHPDMRLTIAVKP